MRTIADMLQRTKIDLQQGRDTPRVLVASSFVAFLISLMYLAAIG